MDPKLATTIIYAAMTVSGLIWLATLRSLQRLLATESQISDQATLAQSRPCVQRAVLQTALREPSPNAGAGAHLLEGHDDLLLFQLAGGTLVAFRFQEDYEGTHVRSEIDLSKPKRSYGRVMAGLVVLMPVVILVMGFALLHFVAHSPHAGTRWQSIQILQLAHVLWPPFLVSKLFQARLMQAVGLARAALVSAKLAEDVPAA